MGTAAVSREAVRTIAGFVKLTCVYHIATTYAATPR